MSLRERTAHLLRGWLEQLEGAPPSPGAPSAPAAEESPSPPEAPAAVGPSFQPTELPPEVADDLRPDHPRLAELRRRYAAFTAPVTDHVSWTEDFLRDALEMSHFRGDNAYVWQIRGLREVERAEMSYLLTAYALRSIDHLGLFDRLAEDGLFGVHTFQMGDGGTGVRKISRDLLDSINEIHFLERHLGISKRTGLRVLDIGAGYGRLAHRMSTALPNLERYILTDAVAESTYLSEVYTRFRGLDRAQVVPLDEIEAYLEEQPIDLLVNMHSFSECTLAAVEWWLDLVAKRRVPHLMIVPNDGAEILSREKDGTHRDIAESLAARGYRRTVLEPKFADGALQVYGVHGGYYHLYELVEG